MVKSDITLGFEPRIPGSSPGEGTLRQVQCKPKFKKFMKKILSSLAILFLLSIIFVPTSIYAADQGWVTCGNGDNPTPCTLTDFLDMTKKILDFLVNTIAAPLAGVAIIVGGILMMTSAGNPNLMGLGKKIFWSAIIGLILAFAAKAIINFVLIAIGWQGAKL